LANIDFTPLKQVVKGEIYLDNIRRSSLSTDASIFMVEPTAVIYPKNLADIIQIVGFANINNITLHSRGAGSGLVGSALGRGIIIDFTKYMNNIIQLDTSSKMFSCEPGYRHGELELLLKSTNLFFPPAPSSAEYATFGGMYATNAGGAYSVKYGNAADYLIDAEVVFADSTIYKLSEIAEIEASKLPENLKKLYKLISANINEINYAYPPIKCNVSGYELRDMVKDDHLYLHKLLGGSEGTLAIVTKLTFALKERKSASALVVAYFDDKITSAKASQIILQHDPASIEIMDKTLLNLATIYRPELKDSIPPNIDNLLMIEFDGDSEEEVVNKAKKIISQILSRKLTKNINMATDKKEIEQLSAVRKAAVPILYQLKSDKKIVAIVEDAAVPTDKLTDYFDGLYKIFSKHNVDFVSYGHIAKGLLHNRPFLNLKDLHDVELLKILADEVFELVSLLNGTISGEHGDGRVRSCYIPKQYKSINKLFLKVKGILDSNHLLNPEIKTHLDVFQVRKDLRYGGKYLAVDNGINELLWNDESFIIEAERCHGCSKCTTVTDATRMCPVYKVTRDENASPKAKANILRAYLSGRLDDNIDIYNPRLQEIINNCVNCGSCSIECPSKVNIPKLALEVKSRYVKKHGAPLQSYIVTNFELAGKLFKRFGSLISVVMRPTFMRRLSQLVTGLAYQRKFVKFSRKTLADFRGTTGNVSDKVVLYFAGCYASYIRPEITDSTINVLKKLGYKVLVPEQSCCGIPHISKGMADKTRDQIKKNIKLWGQDIYNIEHIVTSCSSCALSLLKEWSYYLDSEEVDIIRSKTIYITDLIKEDVKHYIKKDSKDIIKVAYHASCHMKLLSNPKSTLTLLSEMENIDSIDLDSSCCGMAGSWGLAAKNYEKSVDISSRMINKLNKTSVDYGVTDCPTCAMQMEHLGNKKILHPIEVIEKCLK